MKGILCRSLEQKLKLTLIYMDSSGRLSQRTIRVIGVREEDVLAFCYMKKQVRTFKQKNILAAHPCQGTLRKGKSI
ncbi:hypothetical protein Q7A53_14050 [Halobacillus rhizosphaerae]|uniref:hypothetical protein n=1 Tax=Halobacillus rhizosphaerae TaxID=3064889 RepID=UPI00398B73C0